MLGKCSVLVLLGLSSAFDMADRTILLYRLNHSVGITGSHLAWFASYLSETTFSIISFSVTDFFQLRNLSKLRAGVSIAEM